jgi:hypothetical protein
MPVRKKKNLAGKSEARNTKFETEMLNPKLEILNSKQTQMFKEQNSKPYGLKEFGSINEKSELHLEFCILDLFRI